MTFDEAIQAIKNELLCVSRQTEKGCERECGKCDLVLTDDVILSAYDMALSALRAQQEAEKNEPFKWTFVKDHLPECEKGCEVGPVLFCTNHFVYVGYYGRGGKYRDSYFRNYCNAGEGMASKYIIAWAWVSSLNPPKEAHDGADT